MIFINNKQVTESDFISLLGVTKNFCVDEINARSIRKMGGVEFEDLTCKMMIVASKGTHFEGDIVQTGPQTFPDIIAGKFYGTEVKVTDNDKWVSIGNSVAEGTRSEEVERIYLFFGKLGGSPDIKYRPYQECLSDVAVTHSPRYKINMDLPKGESIFDKVGIDYDVLRKGENPILTFKSHYRKLLKKGEELWWIDNEPEAMRPSVRYLDQIDLAEREQFVVESMILFPEIFSNSPAKYKKAAAYLLTEFNTISTNIRDYFSSDGKKNVDINGQSYTIPNKLWRLMNYAKAINNSLTQMSAPKLEFHWMNDVKEPRLEQWLSMLDGIADTENEGLPASKLFYASLYGENT